MSSNRGVGGRERGDAAVPVDAERQLEHEPVVEPLEPDARLADGEGDSARRRRGQHLVSGQVVTGQTAQLQEQGSTELGRVSR